MRKFVLATLFVLCLPFMAMSQVADDLYFVPSEKKVKEVKEVTVVQKKEPKATVRTTPKRENVVQRKKSNKMRSIDEYNRRYNSRDYDYDDDDRYEYDDDRYDYDDDDDRYEYDDDRYERGHWVNGFEGSRSDYEYAMRIIRFRSPRFAISISSPLYWDVVYSLPSWEWNVYNDGFYAYAFPTFSNRLWWDWRWNFGWHSSWYCSSWYRPSFYCGGFWGPHYPYYGYYPHHYPHYYANVGWGGGYWRSNHGWYGSTAFRPGIHSGRYAGNYRSSVSNRGTQIGNSVRRNSNSRGNSSSIVQRDRRQAVSATRRSANRGELSGDRRTIQNNRRTVNGRLESGDRRVNSSVRRSATGRVVRGNNGEVSIRPSRSAGHSERTFRVPSSNSQKRRSSNSYVPSDRRRGSSYNRPSSTRRSVNGVSSSQRNYRRNNESSYNGSRNSRSSYSRNYNSSSSRSHSSYSSSRRSSSSSRSSFSSGGGSRSRSSFSGGGGSHSRSGGGSHRR